MIGLFGGGHDGQVDRDGFVLDGSDPSPVAQAIVKGLAMAD